MITLFFAPRSLGRQVQSSNSPSTVLSPSTWEQIPDRRRRGHLAATTCSPHYDQQPALEHSPIQRRPRPARTSPKQYGTIQEEGDTTNVPPRVGSEDAAGEDDDPLDFDEEEEELDEEAKNKIKEDIE